MRPSKAARAVAAVDAARGPRIEQLGRPLDCADIRSLTAQQAFKEGKRASAVRALCKRATRLPTLIAAAGPAAASERFPNACHPGSRVGESATPRGRFLNGLVEKPGGGAARSTIRPRWLSLAETKMG
jgi:hypothetical protein